MEKNKSGIPSVQDLLITAPLYLEYDISGLPKETILELEFFQGAVDAYCVECKRPSIFHGKVDTRRLDDIRRHESSLDISLPENMPIATERSYAYKDRNFEIELSCTRVPNHRIHFFFLVWKSKLIKVGQYPSLADFQLPSLDKYNRILTKDERQEFAKAIGLCAHGIGIGSFVYLRRIFEKLIEKAHKKARCEVPDWDENTYQKNWMDEKISMLSNYLPEFLVKNASIYSILSKGIHSLSECECLKYFDTVKQGIELILDEEIEKQEKEKRVKSIKNEIAKIKGNIK